MRQRLDSALRSGGWRLRQASRDEPGPDHVAAGGFGGERVEGKPDQASDYGVAHVRFQLGERLVLATPAQVASPISHRARSGRSTTIVR